MKSNGQQQQQRFTVEQQERARYKLEQRHIQFLKDQVAAIIPNINRLDQWLLAEDEAGISNTRDSLANSMSFIQSSTAIMANTGEDDPIYESLAQERQILRAQIAEATAGCTQQQARQYVTDVRGMLNFQPEALAKTYVDLPQNPDPPAPWMLQASVNAFAQPPPRK